MAINHFSQVDVWIEDISASSAMFALQGPKAESVLKAILSDSETPPASWRVLQTNVDNSNVIISGTGYSGEAGYEIIVLNTTSEDSTGAENVWLRLLSAGSEFGKHECV